MFDSIGGKILNRFETVIRQALEASGAETFFERSEVFAKAREGLEKIIATREEEVQQQMREELSRAIEEIEAQFSAAPAPDPQELPDLDLTFPEDPVFAEEPAFAELPDEQPSIQPRADKVELSPADFTRPQTMPAPDTPVSPGQNKIRWIAGFACLAVLSVVAVMFATGNFSGDSSGSTGLIESAEPTGANFVLDLSQFDKQLSAKAEASAPLGQGVTVVESDGKKVLNITGNSAIYSRQDFPVDPQKQYEMAISIRTLPNSAGTDLRTVTLAGLATFDKDGNLETSKPGTHRYGLISDPVFSKDGWKVYRTVFTGTEADPNSFRPGTKSARVAVLVNLNRGAPRSTQIEWITFKELP